MLLLWGQGCLLTIFRTSPRHGRGWRARSWCCWKVLPWLTVRSQQSPGCPTHICDICIVSCSHQDIWRVIDAILLSLNCITPLAMENAASSLVRQVLSMATPAVCKQHAACWRQGRDFLLVMDLFPMKSPEQPWHFQIALRSRLQLR